jgi:HSP20 family protein
MRIIRQAPGGVHLRHDIDHLFDRIFGSPVPIPAASTHQALWTPALDFSETGRDYLIRIEVPGIPKENLDVHLDGQMLTFTGHREPRKEEHEEFFWREREDGRFVRSLRIPTPVDEAGIEAICQDGVMTVRLPKVEHRVRSQITIR